MVGEIRFFESINHLAPKCPNCKTVLDYGTNTKYNQRRGCHTCNGCGEELK